MTALVALEFQTSGKNQTIKSPPSPSQFRMLNPTGAIKVLTRIRQASLRFSTQCYQESGEILKIIGRMGWRGGVECDHSFDFLLEILSVQSTHGRKGNDDVTNWMQLAICTGPVNGAKCHVNVNGGYYRTGTKCVGNSPMNPGIAKSGSGILWRSPTLSRNCQQSGEIFKNPGLDPINPTASTHPPTPNWKDIEESATPKIRSVEPEWIKSSSIVSSWRSRHFFLLLSLECNSQQVEESLWSLKNH